MISVCLLLSFSSAATFGYTYLDNGAKGNITKNYNQTYINQTIVGATYYNVTNVTNNTYINQTVNATVNSTQFSSNSPITIDTSWLTSFINLVTGGLYCELAGCTMSGNINMDNNNLTNVNYINKVGFRNVTTMGNEIIWEIELDN